MRSIIGIVCIIMLIVVIIASGCISRSSDRELSQNASKTTTMSTQGGTIKILDYHYKPYKGGKTCEITAQNVGTTIVSGKIEYILYDCDREIVQIFAAPFRDMNPGETFQVSVDIGDPAETYDITCYWTLNADQKLTTIGEGPRTIPV